MADLVVTVPKQLWAAWIAEGDAAGEPATGEGWAFYVGRNHPPIDPGERLYIVAWNRLRGYVTVTRVVNTDKGYAIWLRGGAVAVTIGPLLEGFPGWRRRWWSHDDERPFPEWRTAGVG